MRNLNMFLNRFRLTKKELELYGCNGDEGKELPLPPLNFV